MTITATISVRVLLLEDRELPINMARLGAIGDDPTPRDLAFGVLGKNLLFWRRYNAVTLNDMLYARYQSRFSVVCQC